MQFRYAVWTLFFVLLLGSFPMQAQAQQAIFLVRHAEKQDASKDPPLSQEGRQRAQKLAELLGSTGVSVVFTSQYLRTQQTAQPLCDQLHLTSEAVPAEKSEELLAKIRHHPKEMVLVVGHSNTIGDIAKGLGCTQSIDIKETQYHRLFIVIPRPSQEPLLLELSY